MLLLQLVISAEEKVENQPERPDSLQIQFSKITASNTHIEDQFTLTDLQGLLRQYVNCDMFKSADFPNDTCNMASIPKIFQNFADGRLNPYLCGYTFDLMNGKLPDGFSEADFENDAIQLLLRTNTLKRDMRCDMWGLCVDQVWVEFLGVPTSRTRPVPFIESFPLTLWVSQPSAIPDGVMSPSNGSEQNNRNLDGNVESDVVNEKRNEKRKNRQLLKQYYSDESEETSPIDSQNENSFHGDDARNCQSCDNNDGDVQYTTIKIADFNVVAKIGGKIRAQLNNSQYLFLMRLLDSLSNFQVQLNADTEEFFKGSNSQAKSFSLPIVIPDLEFAMVCPYIAELLPLALVNPADRLCSANSESFDGREGYGDTDSDAPVEPEGTSNGDSMDQPEHVLSATQLLEGLCVTFLNII